MSKLHMSIFKAVGLGRQIVEHAHLGPILKELDLENSLDSPINILHPFGKDLIHAKHDTNDYDNTAKEFNDRSVEGASYPPDSDLEDAAKEEPSDKHNPCFYLNRVMAYKAYYLNQLFKEFKTPGS